MRKIVTFGVVLAAALTLVENEKVEKILKAAMCAPSAMDKRPWEFVVVKDKWNPAKIHADRW